MRTSVAYEITRQAPDSRKQINKSNKTDRAIEWLYTLCNVSHKKKKQRQKDENETIWYHFVFQLTSYAKSFGFPVSFFVPVGLSLAVHSISNPSIVLPDPGLPN